MRIDFTTKNTAWHSRNQNSEYLAQRRKGKNEKFPNLASWRLGNTEIEIRQVFEAEDFGAEFTPELREQQERLRAQIVEKK